jgi:hypothetical protein
VTDFIIDKLLLPFVGVLAVGLFVFLIVAGVCGMHSCATAPPSMSPDSAELVAKGWAHDLGISVHEVTCLASDDVFISCTLTTTNFTRPLFVECSTEGCRAATNTGANEP